MQRKNRSPRKARPPRSSRPPKPLNSPITGAPIVGVVGANGVGKTLLAVQYALADMSRGRTVYSTVPIEHPVYGSSKPITTLRQLLQLRDCTILIDEVAVVFSARSTGSMPPEVVTLLQVLRHRNLTVIWTSPSWANADVMLRRVTQVLVVVAALARRSIPGQFWPRPTLIGISIMDTSTVPESAQPERVMKRRFYFPSRLASWGSYDTHADTPQIGHAPESGACPDCGGRRTAPACSTERHRELGIPDVPRSTAPASSRRTR